LQKVLHFAFKGLLAFRDMAAGLFRNALISLAGITGYAVALALHGGEGAWRLARHQPRALAMYYAAFAAAQCPSVRDHSAVATPCRAAGVRNVLRDPVAGGGPAW
jgi:hypothetical protein